ncbi:hypothetical protein ACFY7Z_17565 [Streptomyces sp. NPDC012623]|uniref:hypothetical protein n=1 Tax=unclassified Streptomyces TaxID=2593676 RepID=UPI00367840F5
MSGTWYKTAGILSAAALAATGGIGVQAAWGSMTENAHAVAYRVLDSGEGPAFAGYATGYRVLDSGEGPADSGEGPAFATHATGYRVLDSGEGPAFAG